MVSHLLENNNTNVIDHDGDNEFCMGCMWCGYESFDLCSSWTTK